VAALREKYKAVFVDEFQDTDRQQYEVFDCAFSERTILFFIRRPESKASMLLEKRTYSLI
jgi:exodeoxyribonuclease V beta subunit